MKQPSLKGLSLFAVVSVMTALILMGVRGYYAISFAEPLQGMTRGAEYEILYSIWKYVFGGVVYTDQTRIPYDGSYYNWLFYASYGEVAGLVLKVLSLGDAWLPTITRLTTFSGLVVGSFFAYLSFADVLEVKDRSLKLLCGAFAVFVFFGPLIGFFGISATPDIWPLVLTLIATWIFIRHYDSRPLGAILMVCVFSYLAWSFKQNFVYAPATVGLYLLLRRQWRDAIILTIVLVSAGLITMAIGGPIYTKMLHYSGSHIFFTFELLVRNIVNYSVKALPVLAVFAATLVYYSDMRLAVSEKIKLRPIMLIPFLGFLIAGLEALATGGLQASSESHFFMFSYYAAFSALALLVWLYDKGPLSKAFIVIMAVGWVGNIAGIGTVLTGVQGVLSVRPAHQNLMAAKSCLTNLREPFFLSVRYLALPWMTPAKIPFVVHANYIPDRAAGVKIERDGIGGLIDQGYFATLAIGKESNGFDGSGLELYRPRSEPCGGLIIYDRKGPER